jgi:replicative DNA helicase Mcm
MLRKIAEIPGNLYGSVTTASGVGLTAAVVREKTEIGDDTWVIKPGLLVKANKGTACIDELTVNKDLQSFVLEAMESQTIHISKGGINAKLPSECAIIAACNPRWGRFDPNVSIPEQINIPAPMLSRFDLIFPIKDEADRLKDKDIAKHIINVHRAYLNKEISENMKLDHIIIDDVLIDRDFVIKYITYAKQKSPIISKEAEELLTEFYLNMRKGSVQITARQLEAAIRVAEAHAKAKLKEVVEEEDASEAINIITESLKEIAYDPETGQFDVDKISGVSRKDRNIMMNVYDIIKSFAENSETGLALKEDILESGKSKGVSEENMLSSIKKLIKNGDIDEPKTGKYRII